MKWAWRFPPDREYTSWKKNKKKIAESYELNSDIVLCVRF